MARFHSTDYPPGSPMRLQLEKAEAELAKRAEERDGGAAARSSRSRLEDSLQRECISTADGWPLAALFPPGTWPPYVRSRTVGEFLFHIPNGGARSAAEAGILIGLGVRPGVADLFLSLPVLRDGRPWAGLYMELKVDGNEPTEKQARFLGRMSAVGYETTVVRTGMAFQLQIETYLAGARPLIQQGEPHA